MNQKTLINVKTRLSIDDKLQDDLLELLINDAEKHLKLLIDVKEVPEELDFIIENVVVTKFNRRGSEGFKSESVGEHSISIETDDFKPYVAILDKYIQVDPYTTRVGKVLYD